MTQIENSIFPIKTLILTGFLKIISVQIKLLVHFCISLILLEILKVRNPSNTQPAKTSNLRILVFHSN